MKQHSDTNQDRRRAFLYQVSLLVLTGLLGWSEVSYSGGPNFTADVEIATFTPELIFNDTTETSNEASWRLRVDTPVNEAFAVRWSDNGTSAHPLIIEKEAPDDSVYIDDIGRVGLGTAAPAEDLHIVDGFPKIRFEQNFGILQTWDLQADSGALSVRDITNSRTLFSIRPATGPDSNFVTIDGDGNLGVGTQSPDEAVEVFRSEQASRFELTSVSDNPSDAPQFIQRRARGIYEFEEPVQDGDNLGLFSFRGMRPNGSFSGSQATITAQATQDWTNSARGTRLLFGTTPNGSSSVTTVMEITHDGRVLINGAQLAVPDYVFADDYELMPLDELQAYIAEHKHLPEVTSEAEVKAGGVDLTGTQMALLKKVEELTLYTLQQHEQLATLGAQNTQLSQQSVELTQQNAELTRQNMNLAQKDAELTQQNLALKQKDTELERRLAALERQLQTAVE